MPSSQPPDSAPPPDASRVGPVDDAFEHYRIFRKDDGSLWELGHGAMGVTYKAVDTNLDKQVALKIINAQSFAQDSARKRFRREARAAASLHHRHIATVFHLGESSGNFFYAMEFVDGQTVERLVKRDGPLPWRAAVAITVQVTRALMAAHAKGLVHRDIKPSNIMIVDEVDESGVVKLIDFGLAKSAVEADGQSSAVTNASGFLGTPLYASPEQCEELPADIRSDIYSLGVTLWFMLTGEPTFQGTLGKVFHQQMYATPPYEKLPADLPPGVRKLIERMLAKDREHRPQTPADLRAEAETCLNAPGVGGGLTGAVASAGVTLEKSLAEMLKALAGRAAAGRVVISSSPSVEAKSNGKVGGTSRRTASGAPPVPAPVPVPVPTGPVAGTPLSAVGGNGAETLVEAPAPPPVVAGGPVNPAVGQAGYPPDPSWKLRKWGIVAVVIALIAVLASQDKSEKSDRSEKSALKKSSDVKVTGASDIPGFREAMVRMKESVKRAVDEAKSHSKHGGNSGDGAEPSASVPPTPDTPADSADSWAKITAVLKSLDMDSDDVAEMKEKFKGAGQNMLSGAQQIPDLRQRAKVLTGIAIVQAKTGYAEASARTFVLATQAAESIKDEDERVDALKEITAERGKSLDEARKAVEESKKAVPVAVPIAVPVASPSIPPIPDIVPPGASASPAAPTPPAPPKN